MGGVPADTQNGDDYGLGPDGHGIPEGREFHEDGMSRTTGDTMTAEPTFKSHDEDDANANGMDKNGAFSQREHQHNMDHGHGEETMLEVGEHGLDEETEAPMEGLSSEVETITRQAKNQLDTTLHEASQLALDLSKELTAFLNEAVGIQRDFQQVELAVKAESDRLDNLQPTVEEATRMVLLQAQAGML